MDKFDKNRFGADERGTPNSEPQTSCISNANQGDTKTTE